MTFDIRLNEVCVRVGVRYVITKFSRLDSLPNFLTHGAPLCAHFARARAPLQILQTDLHTFPLRISWENLIKHQGIFSFMVILYIHTALSLDNVWILLGENCYWSLLGHKGLVAIWLSGKHICTSPLTENTLRVHVLAHLQSLFVSLLLCISATKTQWNRTSEFLGMCHGHWRPPVLCMAGYPAENGKCCKMYVQEKNNQ